MSNVVFFDGVGAVLNIGDAASLRFGVDNFTLCLRVKIQPTLKLCELFSKSPYGGNSGFGLDVSPPNLRFIIRYVGSAAIFAPLFYPADGRWHHIAAVRSGNNAILYLDGLSQTSVGIFVHGEDASAVGSNLYSGVNWAANSFNYKSEMQAYNRALTADEIKYNYEHPGNPIKRGIQLNLTQESIQGAQWLDLSGNANHGTYVGGAVPRRANLVTQR